MDWGDGLQYLVHLGNIQLSASYVQKNLSAQHVFGSGLSGRSSAAADLPEKNRLLNFRVLYDPSEALSAGFLYSKARDPEYSIYSAYLERALSETFSFHTEIGRVGSDSRLEGVGAILDLDYKHQPGKNHVGLELGYATGDKVQASSNDSSVNEAFYFHRNRSPTLLLFNYPLGSVNQGRGPVVFF